MLCSRTAPVDFFLISVNSQTHTTTTLKRPILSIAISLLTLGGLYILLNCPGTQTSPTTESGPKSPLVPTRATDRADISSTDQILSPKNQAPAETQVADSGVRNPRAQSPAAPTAQPQAFVTPSPVTDRRLADAPAEVETAPEAQRSPVGIRLAPNVRLPLAAMPNDLKLNPIKQQALQHIIDEYYQTVAAAASAPKNGDSASNSTEGSSKTSVVEENGEQTQIVTNSPAVESARLRADQLFKALFGKAAYNRMTMNTLLESRLPVPPAEP